MTFKALRMLSDSEVEMTFEGDDGTAVIHVFTVQAAGLPALAEDVAVVNCDTGFWHRYRRGPDAPRWPERLAAEAWRAARQPFPAGPDWDRRVDEVKTARRIAWEARPASEEDRRT